MGSTMRLGSRRTLLHSPDCLTAKLMYACKSHVMYSRPQYVDGAYVIWYRPLYRTFSSFFYRALSSCVL
ncbi:hypothetical protein ACS0TY_007410 [Phlomoides rotata]